MIEIWPKNCCLSIWTSNSCSWPDIQLTSSAHHVVLDEGVHFIQKPFSIRNLAAKVRAMLEGKSENHC